MNIKARKGHLLAVKWLLKAVSSEKDRPVMQLVRVVSPGVWEGTDGYKIHRLKFKIEDLSQDEYAVEQLNAIQPGLYSVKVDGSFIVVEASGEGFHFPDTYAITGGTNRKLSRLSVEKLKPEDMDVCHISIDPALLTETLTLKDDKGVVAVHIEIGQLTKVSAEGHYADYFAVVMPMFRDLSAYGLEFSSPSLGKSVEMPLQKQLKHELMVIPNSQVAFING